MKNGFGDREIEILSVVFLSTTFKHGYIYGSWQLVY